MISMKEYQQRRRDLAERMPIDAVAVIPAQSEIIRNGDSHYRFRQDSDFYYLTGFNEPDAVLLIFAGPEGRSILFNRERHKEQEQWTGRRLGQAEAIDVLGVDEAWSLNKLEQKLPEFLAEARAIFYPLGRFPQFAKKLLKAWVALKGLGRRGVIAPEAFYDLEPMLSEQRLFKSTAEIKLIERAVDLSIVAHERVMRACQSVSYEYQLEAELLYAFTEGGCRSVAYDPIVASGNNACVLHYTDNQQLLKPDALILVDAGGEFQNYAADITRTFPKNGRFSEAQRNIYSIVLKAQTAGITLIKPGCCWDEIQRAMVKVLTEGLIDCGILCGAVDVLIEQEAYKPFYMHQSGHWLGLDVHDCGRYKQEGVWRQLEPGMVLTVEPGLYISEGQEGVDERFWGIGVRIEDDILVTKEGHRNLSSALAVEIDELEALTRGE